MPNNRWRWSRSTASCALRTQVAGSPPVSEMINWIGRPITPAFGVHRFGPEFRAAPHLLADRTQRPGQCQRHADFDGICAERAAARKRSGGE